MTAQTIGYDKINQLRHVQFFKNADGVRKHMQILADCLKPKFETVLNTLEKELKGSGLITWENPKGGYFASVDVLPGCAKRVVELAKEAGVALTGAGAHNPYKNDPKRQQFTNRTFLPYSRRVTAGKVFAGSFVG